MSILLNVCGIVDEQSPKCEIVDLRDLSQAVKKQGRLSACVLVHERLRGKLIKDFIVIVHSILSLFSFQQYNRALWPTGAL